MRRVDRSGTSPSDEWLERAELLQHSSKPEKFSDHYSHSEVHAALARIFRRKCAYCEARDNSMEIEHFRPKARVEEEPTHDGYYWLAYAWANLLPACAACNKRLRDAGVYPAKGKGNQFPLLAGSPRAFAPSDDLAAEQRLLLDPCSDEPDDHLRLQPTGGLEGLSDRGKTSIEVYHLAQSTKEMRRKMVLDQLIRAHRRRDVEELRIVLSDEGEFCGLLRAYYSNLVARDWREYLEELAAL